MKFAICKLLVQLILFVYFTSDVIGTQVVTFTDSNSLTIAEQNTSLLPLVLIEDSTVNRTSINRNKSKAVKKRRRLRRKKKRPRVNLSTTVIPNVSTVVATVKYPNETVAVRKNQKRRKLKKRRKQATRTRKGNIQLESKSLVLPIIPTQSTSLVLPITSTTHASVQRRKSKKTRCSTNNGGCAHICHPKGTQKCQCFKGFTLAKDKFDCTDINECLINNGECEMNCTNTIGSYRCQCSSGLRLSLDSKSCEDINECLLRNGHGPCQDTCENTHGGYKCSCGRLKGAKLGNDLHSCVDLDECARDNGGCSHICINTFGRSFCSCPEGLELSGDFKTCQDINECENESIKHECPNGCINTEGSYRCATILDLQNDESHKEVVCKPLFPPQNGYFKCSRKHALKTFAKNGRKRIKNSLGTKCILVCPEGFKRRGQGFRISCGYGGQWTGHMDAKCVTVR